MAVPSVMFTACWVRFQEITKSVSLDYTLSQVNNYYHLSGSVVLNDRTKAGPGNLSCFDTYHLPLCELQTNKTVFCYWREKKMSKKLNKTITRMDIGTTDVGQHNHVQ